ncbi:MAG: pyridoxal kinase [Salaquimonas sp.]|jgi:pyridoxine kinase|nr:pyridoxal kinase [Salaquimonas sp.]
MNGSGDEKRPAILSISSHVARGSVGNRGIVFALETLGHAVWSVNTVSLPFHPGHGKATRLVPDTGQFQAYLDDLLASPWVGEIGGVLTGYMGDAAQAQIVGGFVGALKERNSGLVTLCDPIIGDHGGLYVAEDTARAIRDHLVTRADIATPNVHELAWLTGESGVGDAGAVVHMARRLGPATVIATSAPAMMRDHIGNLLVDDKRVVMAEHRLVERPPNGPGDLVSGLFLAHLLAGMDPVQALERATASVFEIVMRAAKRGSSELMLAADKGSIMRPMAMINLRSVVVADTVRK